MTLVFFIKKIDTNQFFLDYVVIMNEEPLNRASLEKLSFSDLVQLADEYGVDVPEDLDRRFLIAELLELFEESNNKEDEMIIATESDDQQPLVLNGNFNETQVSCVLRNPAWLFVFWNLNDSDLAKIEDNPGCSLKLRICSFENPGDSKADEAFEIQTASQSQEQYVLLPKGKNLYMAKSKHVSRYNGGHVFPRPGTGCRIFANPCRGGADNVAYSCRNSQDTASFQDLSDIFPKNVWHFAFICVLLHS